LREEAEDDTDQYFYAPFRDLSQTKIKELKSLLEELAEVVKESQKEGPA
jgi:hypothetical protein